MKDEQKPTLKRLTNPKKLMLSKWTAVHPQHKEKHFLITKVLEPEDGSPITQVIIEAVYTKRSWVIDWKTLEDTAIWQAGWH